MNHQDLIKKIKSKKELSGISDNVVENLLNEYLKKYHSQSLSDKYIIKEIRSDLRKYSGRFKINPQKTKSLLKRKDYNSLLKMHSSTKEREDSYPIIKRLISNLNIHSILDLGCGLNPLVIANNSINYNAYDINESDLDAVKQFFLDNKIKGQVKVYDLLRNKEPFPKVDLCILFKVLDILDIKNHKPSEELIKRIDSKYFIISFSTKTLSGKPMNHPQRGWIEKMLSRLGYNYRIIKTKNEIYYLASMLKLASE